MFDELISNLSNIQVFTESLHGWVSGLSVNSAIIFVMMLFMLLGAVDKIRGNKWGDVYKRQVRTMSGRISSKYSTASRAPYTS